MQVYIELTLAENFCMDYFLLYCAKAATKNRAGIFRLAAAAAFGACFAAVFPLIPLPPWAGIIIKVSAGLALCAGAGKYSEFKGYVKFAAVFFALTFALGGALTGIFTLADISYEEGGTFIISSVPVGIPLFCALVLALGIRTAARKYVSARAKTQVKLHIYAGETCVSVAGFYDSGNKVFYRGEPVSIVPGHIAAELTDVEGIKTFTKIHTVAGSKKIAIFTADKMVIDDGKQERIIKKVTLGVAPNVIAKAVLNPDLAEVN